MERCEAAQSAVSCLTSHERTARLELIIPSSMDSEESDGHGNVDDFIPRYHYRTRSNTVFNTYARGVECSGPEYWVINRELDDRNAVAQACPYPDQVHTATEEYTYNQ